MINAGRGNADIKVLKALGDISYTNNFIITAKAETNSTDWQLATTLDNMKILPYHLLTTAQKVYVASTDADDDFVTGQGAKQLSITGLDADYKIQEELIELDGLTPVESIQDFIRVFEMTILTYGTNTEITTGDSIQAGDIYVGTGIFALGIPENKLCAISASDNDPNSRVGIFTVPSGFIAIIKGITLFSTPDNQLANAMYFTTSLHFFGTPEEQKYKFSVFYFDGQFQYVPESLPLFPPRADVAFRIKNQNTKSKEVTIFFDIELRELR